jgi:hypothetical protein
MDEQLLGNNQILGKGSEDVHYVQQLKDSQVPTTISTPLEKVNYGLGVFDARHSVDQR